MTHLYLSRAAAALLAASPILAFAAEPAENTGEAPLELDQLVVTAALEPVTLREVASSITIITREQIEQRQVRYLSELLRDVPGFAVSQAGGAGAQTQVRVRGAEANQLLVLVDGIRANDPASNDEFQYQYALTEDIERIEIVRGPQSSIWGTDALAGVVNIIRRRDVAASEVAGRFEAGSFDTTSWAARGSWAGNRSRLYGSVTGFATDGSNISRQGDEADGADNSTLDLGLDIDLSADWLLRLSGQQVNADSDYDEIDFGTSLPADADRISRAERSYLGGELRWAPAASAWSGSFTLNRSDSDNDNHADGQWTDSTAAEETEARLHTSVLLPGAGAAGNHRLTFALDQRDTEFRQRGEALPWGDPNQDQSYDVTGYAAEYVGRAGEALTWTASARHDDFSDFDATTTWQLAAGWQLMDALRLRGALGTGSKAPTFTERFGFYPDQFIGNPLLEPETSEGWELGLDATAGNGRLRGSLVYFEQELENEIDGFVFDPDSFLYTARNKDVPSQRQGVELSGSWLLAGGLDLTAGYTWTDATEQGPLGQDVREVRRPEHQASLGVNWRFAQERANLNLNINYTGDQDDLFFDPVTFAQQTVVLDSHTVADLAGSWQLGNRLQLLGRVTNLTDADYEEVLGFVRPGRAFYAGLRGTFGP
jgi:vitamin B12 transporter